MSDNFHFYKTSDDHRLAHNPFNAIIAPRPIGWISSVSHQGIPNLAPYSFFNAFNYTPPIIGFSSIGYKDSLRNIEETGEFCWNLVSAELAEPMNKSCAVVPPQTDEFELAGLKKGESKMVTPPHVTEAGVVMECKKTQIIRLQDTNENELDTWMVFGEVIGIHIRKSLIEDNVFSTLKANPLMRAGGAGDYFTVDEANKFEMLRP